MCCYIFFKFYQENYTSLISQLLKKVFLFSFFLRFSNHSGPVGGPSTKYKDHLLQEFIFARKQ